MNLMTAIHDNGHPGLLFIQTTEAERALFPKSYRITRGYEQVNLSPSDATGERNEAGIKRVVGMIKKIRAAGGDIVADYKGCRNAATLAEIEAYLAA